MATNTVHYKAMPFGWSCAVVTAAALLPLLPLALASLVVTTGDDSFVRTMWCCAFALFVLAAAGRWLDASTHLAAYVVALIAVLMMIGAVEVQASLVI